MKRFALLLLLPLAVRAQSLKEFEKKITEFTLANGLHFIVCERHEAPVVSFHTYVNAGSVNDPSGYTGIAHMFEHMAFKGTTGIGTLNWAEEKKALEEVEAAYDGLDAERNKGPRADQQKVKGLRDELSLAISKANAFIEPNQYPMLIEMNGGAGMNAQTSLDATQYFYSLPSNRLELWFMLESQRFLDPVFREFYKERDVVMEEYRQRIESNPQGKLIQTFLATAFAAHPYRVVGTGWPSDIQNLRRADAVAFFQKYYVPGNISIAIVGDINPAEAKRMAEKYFGPLAGRPLPPVVHTAEPPQAGARTAEVRSPAQPVLIVGYKRPDVYDKDDPVFDVMGGILSGGRTGILYKTMVRDKKIALQAQTASTFPDGRYPNLFVAFVVPNLGHSVEENQKELFEIIEKFKKDPVDPVALKRVKTETRAGLIRSLDSNPRLASYLTLFDATYGDWRKLFTSLDDVEKVSADDVQRVARKYLVPETRTVVYSVQPAAEGSGGSQ